MRKLVIVGISGTGKSVLGRRLAEKTGLTVYHMDSIVWGPAWTETAEHSIFTALAEIAAKERWIVEGWIDHYSKQVLLQSDVILYLDYPGWVAACGGVRRWWRYRGKQRREMPSGCVEKFDPSFLRRILLRQERPHIEALLAEIPQTNIIRVRSRQEADAMCSELAVMILKARERGDGRQLGVAGDVVGCEQPF